MYSFEGRIRFSECDNKGELTLEALLNYFQDCSTFQSEDLGIGLEHLSKQNRVWVLSSWQILVERYPELGEKVEIGTFPYEFKSFMGYRNFFMKTKSGEMVAKASSLWTLLNTETMKPTPPSQEMVEKYSLEPRLEMEYASRKVILGEQLTKHTPIVVTKHHLDANNHVNNGQYVMMASLFLPTNFEIKQMRAEYKMQAHLDDILIPFVQEEQGKSMVSLRNEDGKPYVNVEFLEKERKV